MPQSDTGALNFINGIGRSLNAAFPLPFASSRQNAVSLEEEAKLIQMVGKNQGNGILGFLAVYLRLERNQLVDDLFFSRQKFSGSDFSRQKLAFPTTDCGFSTDSLIVFESKKAPLFPLQYTFASSIKVAFMQSQCIPAAQSSANVDPTMRENAKCCVKPASSCIARL